MKSVSSRYGSHHRWEVRLPSDCLEQRNSQPRPLKMFHISTPIQHLFFSLGTDTTSSFDFYTNALYLSALFTSPFGQASAVDTLSNVKIPTIEKSESTSESDADGWYCVPPEDSTYSLLVGLPIDGTRYNGSYHLCVESLYMVLDCPLVSVSTILSNYTQGCWNPIEGFSLDLKGTSPTLYPNQTSYAAVVPTGADFCASSYLYSDNSFIANCTLTCSSVE